MSNIMIVTPQVIKTHIRQNSTNTTRSRASSMRPQLLTSTQASAEFSCQGSTGNLYNVSISYANSGKGLQTMCSCPFNYEGDCKHIIASLRSLLKQEKKEVEIISNIIPLNKGLLEESVLEKVRFEGNQTWYNDTYRVHTQMLDKLVFTSGYEGYRVTLTCNREEDQLIVDCSCRRRSSFCYHTYDAFTTFMKLYGPAYFTKDFKNKSVKAYMSRMGISDTAKNRSLFKVSISKLGVHIVSKFKNIQPKGGHNVYSMYDSDEERLMMQTPELSSIDSEYGLGFCFEYYGNRVNDIYHFEGKRNKANTDFSSSITVIDEGYMNDVLTRYSDMETKEALLGVLEISEHYAEMNGGPLVLDLLKKVNILYNNLLPSISTSHTYLKEQSTSMAKKHFSPISVSTIRAKMYYEVTENDMFYAVRAMLEVEGDAYSVDAEGVILSYAFVKINDTVYPYHNAEHALGVHRESGNAEKNYFKDDKENLWTNIVKPISEQFEVRGGLFQSIDGEESLLNGQRQVYISDYESTAVVFKLALKYGDTIVTANSSQLIDSDKVFQYAKRNEDKEQEFVNFFESLHPMFDEQDTVYLLDAHSLVKNNWLMETVKKIKNEGIEIFGANDLKSFKYNLNPASISISVRSDIDWFDVNIDVKFGNQKVKLQDLKKAFISKSKYIQLGDGSIGILPEDWMEKFKNYFIAGQIKKDGIQISNYNFGIIDELYNELEVKPSFLEELYQRKERLLSLSTIASIAKPKGVKAKLRPYQSDGLNWMVSLHHNQLGGCLADDMGLGKTLQAITFFKYLKDTYKPDRPSLIVAPTSLIFNWNQEVAKFCKSLKIMTYTGTGREKLRSEFENNDLVISTYGTVVNDIEYLQTVDFNYVLLDESQSIKNPHSKRYKSVRLLSAYNRLVLTGTPIENNTFDLYAQLNFLNPGLLGNMTHFKKTFSDEIDKNLNEEISVLLNRIVSPFMLRRTKEQVATELPEKTESIIYCEMGVEQRKVYEAYKDKYRDYLQGKIAEDGVNKAQMYILEGLTKLRQICNSPALVSSEEESYGNNSVKLDTLVRNIKEKTGSHKILVFSQFVKMLALIKERLNDEKIKYEYLDGQTKDRQKCVENFQNDKSVRVFLISLKAGGTGLNLTEADYVFIVDPWWNPAVENQAIDRCYRIGQKKKVMAYRMICENTIEEKIVQLQSKKKKVASSIISVDEGSKSFDIEEVKDLFG